MNPSPSKRRKYRRSRKSYRISEFDKKKLEHMYYLGLHPLEMAKSLGFSDKTIYRYCTQIFSPINGGWARGYPSQSERNGMCQRYLECNDLRIVAEEYRRPVWVVAGAVRPKGIASLPGAPTNVEFLVVAGGGSASIKTEEPEPGFFASLVNKVKGWFSGR